MSTTEKNELSFPVLSDPGNNVTREFCLLITQPEQLRPLYVDFNIDLSETNGDKTIELPVPATFIIDSNAVINGGFLNAYYKQRIDKSNIVDVLNEIKS